MSQSETRQLTCPNGHRFDIPDSDKAPSRVDCPECDAKILVRPRDTASAGPVGRGRSLWAVMGQGDTASRPADEKTEPTAKEDSSCSEGDRFYLFAFLHRI